MKTSVIQKVASIIGLIEVVLVVPCLVVLIQTMDTYLHSPNSLKQVAILLERSAGQHQKINTPEVAKLSELLSANAELLFWSLIANIFLLVLVFCSGTLMLRTKNLGKASGVS